LKKFHWDNSNFANDKPLAVLGAKISKDQKAADDRLKKAVDE
jgi:hypothetical protein